MVVSGRSAFQVAHHIRELGLPDSQASLPAHPGCSSLLPQGSKGLAPGEVIT